MPVLCDALNFVCLNKRLKIFLNYVVGPVLFVWLSYSIYRQIQHQSDLAQSWNMIRSGFQGAHLEKLVLVTLLMLLSWAIEARKWQVLVRGIQTVSFWRSYKAVFSGQALGFNTLNNVGDSAGRVIFLAEGNRLRGVLLTWVGGMSQIIVIVMCGIFGLLYLRLYILDGTHSLEGLSIVWLDGLIYTTTTGIIIFILMYFRLSWLVQLLEKIPFIAKHKFFVEKLEDFHWRELTRLLFFSLFRYLVFVVQYVLLLQVFEVQVSSGTAAAMVSVMLLVLLIVPSISLAELGFRGKISLHLFGLVSANTIGIVSTVAGIWIINQVIPAIAGSLFILGVRLFRNK